MYRLEFTHDYKHYIRQSQPHDGFIYTLSLKVCEAVYEDYKYDKPTYLQVIDTITSELHFNLLVDTTKILSELYSITLVGEKTVESHMSDKFCKIFVYDVNATLEELERLFALLKNKEALSRYKRRN